MCRPPGRNMRLTVRAKSTAFAIRNCTGSRRRCMMRTRSACRCRRAPARGGLEFISNAAECGLVRGRFVGDRHGTNSPPSSVMAV